MRSVCSPLFLEQANRAEIPTETLIQSKEDTSDSDTQVCHPVTHQRDNDEPAFAANRPERH